MDRHECIRLLVSAGITEDMARLLFHSRLARLGKKRRQLIVEHHCMLAREDAQLRSEK